MPCFQPNLSRDLGGRTTTSEEAGQRLVPDREYPLPIPSLGQLSILIGCSMSSGLTAATRAGVISWVEIALKSGSRAPNPPQPRGGLEALYAGAAWIAPTVASGPAHR